MTQEELLKKIDGKSKKIVAMCKPEESKKVSDLLADIRSLANTIPTMPPEPTKPVHFCINEEDVVDEYDMGACAVTKTKTGFEWRAKGGYRLYTENTNKSLSGAINSFFEARDSDAEKTMAEVENENIIVQALTYVLNYPMIAFSDYEFLVKMATNIVNWMTEKYKEASEEAKEDDNPELTRDLADASVEFEKIQNQINEKEKE